jgi:hypothetical protein
MGLQVPKDLKAIGRLLRGESLASRGRLKWTIHKKTESGKADYEKLLFFPLPGMKALYSTLGLETIVILLSRWPWQPKPATPLSFKPTPFKLDKAVEEQDEAFETVTVTLGPGCTKKGVGVGLNPQNVIDMLVPGKSAADKLQYGDRVILWNNNALNDPNTGVQKKLGSIVSTSLDTHTVVVERPLLPLSGAEKTALIMEATQRSGCEIDGCEAGEYAEQAREQDDELRALTVKALAAEQAKKRMGFAREGFAAVVAALAGEGLEVPAPKAALEKLVEEKIVERE